MKFFKYSIPVLVALLILLPACTKKGIQIRSTAFSDIEYIPKKGFPKNSSFVVYTVSSINGSEDTNALQIKELEQKISIALQKKGCRVASDLIQADYCLVFNYGIESEKKTINVPKPVTRSSGSGSFWGNYFDGGYRHSSESVVYIPEECTFYSKFVTCDVYTAQSYLEALRECKQLEYFKTPQPIWHGSAINTNEDGDLREYLDILLLTIYDLFGKSSRGIVDTTTTTKNTKVALLHKKYQGGDR